VTALRSLAVAAGVVPLATMSVLMVGVAPASAAASGILSPSAGEVIRTSGPVTISAKTGLLQLSMGLYVEGPSVPRRKVAQGGLDQTIKGSFDPGSAPNGVFTVSLRGEITAKTYKTSTFTVSRPPAAPSAVNAVLTGTSNVVVTWGKGSEPDLRSYMVSSTTAAKSGTIPLATACSGSSCRASLTVPAGAAGQRVGFSVQAVRSDGRGGTVASGGSAVSYLNMPAAAQPTPTPAATSSAVTSPPAASSAVTSPPAASPVSTQGSTTAAGSQTQRLTGDTSKAGLTLPDLPDADASPPEVAPPGSTASEPVLEPSGSLLSGPGYGILLALVGALLLLGAHVRGRLKRRKGPYAPTGVGAMAAVPTGAGASVARSTGAESRIWTGGLRAVTPGPAGGGTGVPALAPAATRHHPGLAPTISGTSATTTWGLVRGTATTIARRPSIVLASGERRSQPVLVASPEPVDADRTGPLERVSAHDTVDQGRFHRPAEGEWIGDDDDPYTGRRRREP
jgi:hypothetical protein